MADKFRITVRAFNADGYHKDILSMTEAQVWSSDTRVKEPRESCLTGLLGFGGHIKPSDFPEVTHFEIVVSEIR